MIKSILSNSKLGLFTLAACGALLAAGAPSADAVNISFNTAATPEGTVVNTQFTGVGFVTSPFSGADDSAFYGSTGANFGTWATNTDATVTATDLGAESATVSGVRQLHAYGNTYDGWLSEDGDPAYLLQFGSAISSITVTFAGDSSGSSGLAVSTNGVLSNVTHVAVGSNTVLETATLTGLNTKSILLVPGAYGDWVSVVGIQYTLVPEPSTYAMVGGALALGGFALARRRARATA